MKLAPRRSQARNGIVEIVGLLAAGADAAGLDRAEVGTLILDQADAMGEAEAE